jgi:hypothetical protein
MSTEESQHLEEPMALVHQQRSSLTLHQHTLEIAGVKVANTQEAWEKVRDLPEADKLAQIAKFNRDLLQYKRESEEVLLDWEDTIKKGLSESSQSAYDTENKEFIKAVKDIRKDKEGREKEKRLLENALKHQDVQGKRAEAFLEFIQKDLEDVGMNAYSQLKRLIQQTKDVRRTIRLLNMCTLRRNRQIKYDYGKSALASVDITKALRCHKEEEEIEELKEEDLVKAGLRFGSSGILVKGRYDEEAFPGFPDEAPLQITVTSKAQERFNEMPSKVPDNTDLDDLMSLADKGDKTPELYGARQFEEIVAGDVAAGESSLPAVGTEPVATPEQSGQTETPLRRSKRIHEDSEEKKSGKEKIVESPTPAAKKAKTTPRATAKATPRTTPVTATKLAKKARKAKTVCDGPCGMTKMWYLDLDIWEELSFKDKKNIVKEVADYTIHNLFKSKLPCKRHLQQLGEFLLLKKVDDYDEVLKQVTAIYQVVEYRNSIRRAWVDPNTRAFFQNDPQILQYQKENIFVDRFRPEHVPKLEQPTDSLRILAEQMAVAHEGFWDWIDEKGIKPMLVAEMEMLRFHCRQDTPRGQGELPNSYFTMAAQLLWADPSIWLFAYAHMPNDNNGLFVAYPQPARYFDPGHNHLAFYEGDSLDCGSLWSAEVVLSGQDVKWDYIVPKDTAKFNKLMEKTFEEPKFIDLVKEVDKKKLLLECLELPDKADPFQRSTTILKENELVLRKSRIFQEFTHQLERPWISIPVSFVPIGEDDMAANGVSYWDIAASHNARKAPKVGRFKSTGCDVSFPWSVRLDGLGDFLDMARCVKRPENDVFFRSLMDLYLQRHDKSAELYEAWKIRAAAAVKKGFQTLKISEMKMFKGNKSYFRFLKSKGVISEDDRDFLSTSDEQEDEQVSGEAD